MSEVTERDAEESMSDLIAETREKTGKWYGQLIGTLSEYIEQERSRREEKGEETGGESSEDDEEDASEAEREERDGERDRDAKEAEGPTPSGSVSYASKVAEGGMKSRSWAEEVSKDAEGERAGKEKEGERGEKENGRARMVEKRESERDLTWQWETRERKTRARNLVVRGMEGEKEEVEKRVESWLQRVLEKKVEVEKIWLAKENVVIVRLRSAEEAREILKRKDEIWERWELWVERDRTFRERRTRWMVSNRADQARRGGKEVIEEEGKVCIDGNWWVWKEQTEEWETEDIGETQDTRKTLDASDERDAQCKSDTERVKVWKVNVKRWREDLERRKAELKKEEEELEAEVKRIAGRQETGRQEEGKTEQERTEINGEHERKEREGNGGRQQSKKETDQAEKKAKTERRAGNGKGRGQEKSRTIEMERTERSKEDMDRWRADLERRKEEMRKEEEKLQEEERKIKAAEETENNVGSMLSDVGD